MEMDDFGDLYADLEDHVNAGIPGAPGVCSMGSGEGRESVQNRKEADFIGEEVMSEDLGERDNVALENSGSSDSEDDLHIVLDEGDCSRLPALRREVTGNGGMLAAKNYGEGEEDGNLAITTKDHKWNDHMHSADGLVKGGMEGASAEMAGDNCWHGKSHSAGIPSRKRILVSGRADHDQLLIPTYHTGIHAGAQNEFDFYLPRNRTLFGIDIESFEWKPWRQHRVDIADFFNFGLEEESWKSYCEQIEEYRKQMTIRSPVHESAKVNKVVASDLVSTNNKHSGMGDFRMPNARAIQVESGLSERSPSIDIRCPRHYDSDVVIQISTKDHVQDACSPGKEETEHAKEQVDIDRTALRYEIGNSEGLLSMDREGQREGTMVSFTEHHYAVKSVTKVAALGAKTKITTKTFGEDNSLRASASMLVVESPCDETPFSQDLTGFDNQNNSSKEKIASEDVLSPAEEKSSNSVSGLEDSLMSDDLDRYLSDYSVSDTPTTEQEDGRSRIRGCMASKGADKCSSRRDHCSGAGLDVSPCNDYSSFLLCKKHQDYTDHLEVVCRRGERNSKHRCDGKNSASRVGRGSSVHSERRRDADEARSRRSNNRHSQNKDYNIPYVRRNKRKQGFGFTENDLKRRDFCSHERGSDGFEMRYGCHSPKRKISEHALPRREKYWCLWQEERKDGHHIKVEAKRNDMAIEHGYTRGLGHKVRQSDLTYSDREEEIFDRRSNEHAYREDRERRYSERRSSFESEASCQYNKNDIGSWSLREQPLMKSQTFRAFGIMDARRYDDTSFLANDLPNSRRLGERYLGHSKVHDARDFISKKTDTRFSVPDNENDHYLSYVHAPKDSNDNFINKERVFREDIASSQMKQFNRLVDTRNFDYDEIGSANLYSADMFSPQRSSHYGGIRYQKNQRDRMLVDVQKPFADHCLSNSGKRLTGEHIEDARDLLTNVACISRRGRPKLLAIGHKETVNVHLSNWKGKTSMKSSRVLDGIDRHDYTEQAMDRDSWGVCDLKLKLNHSNWINLNFEKVDSKDMYSVSHGNEDEELEEGQLIEEPDKQVVVPVPRERNVLKKAAQSTGEVSRSGRVKDRKKQSEKDRKNQSEDTSNNNPLPGRYDSDHILEILAKLERRKDRFKEPILQKQEPDKSVVPQTEVSVVADEVKQQRPARKRRWGDR